MTALPGRINLASEPDFDFGRLRVAPSACRVFAGEREVRVEAQTMGVLVVLARAGGATVSRDALVEACWEGRIVSDDAIARTIAKVRAVARGLEPAPFQLETLPKVGYRLIAAETASVAPTADVSAAVLPARPRRWMPIAAAVGLMIAVPVAWIALPREAAPGALEAAQKPGQDLPTAAQVSEALILLDWERVKDYLDKGWDPNWKLDAEGNEALHTMFMACERNPSHDRGKVALIAQTLIAAGEDPAARNKWDDSPLDTAISPRFCGPHHPVTDFLKSMVTPEEITRVMTRACGEAYGGKPSQANWKNSTLTRDECAAVMGK